MPGPGGIYTDVLTSASVAGAPVTTNAADTTLLPAANQYVFNPGSFGKIGQMYRVKASGQISNIVTTPGTLTFKVWLGPTKNINVFAGAAMQLNAVAKTNVTWDMEIVMVLRAIGSGTSANFLSIGRWTSESVVGSAVPGTGGSGSLLSPASAPAVGTGFDSTVANIFDLTANFSLTGNSITLMTFSFEDLNS